jgi:hypothetical protein
MNFDFGLLNQISTVNKVGHPKTFKGVQRNNASRTGSGLDIQITGDSMLNNLQKTEISKIYVLSGKDRMVEMGLESKLKERVQKFEKDEHTARRELKINLGYLKQKALRLAVKVDRKEKAKQKNRQKVAKLLDKRDCGNTVRKYFPPTNILI